ncbi:MAG: murein biosynthesis integral membrane protein MurJ [Bdellovibrionales bacterium]
MTAEGHIPEKKPSVIKAAVAMSLGTILSRILGYVRDAVLLALFSRTVTDAFVVAFRLPNLVRRLLGEGSLSASFIPVYIEQMHADSSGERARNLANATFTLLCSITMTLTVLAFVLMEPLLELWVGDKQGYAAIPGKMELTANLSRIMVAYVFLVTTYAFLMGISNARQKFFIPALAPALFNFVFICFALLPQNLLAVPGSVLAWGVVAGGVVQVVLVAVQLYQIGHLPRLVFNFRVPGLRAVLSNLGPSLIGLGIYQVMTIANTFFAATLPEGTQSYLFASDRILELPQSIIAISLGTALLPAFSRQLAAGNKAAMLETANEGLRAMLFLALPAAVGMFILAQPIIEVLFMRGAFGADDARTTAEIVQVYSGLLVVSSLAKVTVPGFYAIKNTRLPAVVAAIVLLAHLILAKLLIGSYGVVGLATATAVSGALNMIMLQVAFHFWLGPVGLKSIFVAVARVVPALLLMAAVSHFGHEWLMGQASEPNALVRALILLLTIAVAAVTYFMTATLCGSAEAVRTLGALQRRIKAKVGHS